MKPTVAQLLIEFPDIKLNSKIRYRTHKSPEPDESNPYRPVVFL
jgi:hypothetical protein